MNWKYLAFILLLAGWIWFCYRLLSARIIPNIHKAQSTVSIVVMDDLDLPLAYAWGSETPLAGEGFEAWVTPLAGVDSLDQIVVIYGNYFRDEAIDQPGLALLGRRRVEHVLDFAGIDRKRVLIASMPQEINADVRSNPFTAVTFKIISAADVLSFKGDTAQLCFPIADSMLLPLYSLEKFDQWRSAGFGPDTNRVTLIGTADGSGIAESSDMAMDRADYIKQRLIRQRWKAESIAITSGQRNNPHTLLNRCVLVYFERAD